LSSSIGREAADVPPSSTRLIREVYSFQAIMVNSNYSQWYRFWPVCIWLCATAALLIKHDTAVLVWALYCHLFGVRRGLIAMLLSVLVFLVSFMPYAAVGSAGIWRNVFTYQGITTPYGFLILLPRSVNTVLMLTALLLVPVAVRRFPLNKALLVSLLAWLVTASGVGAQYFMLLLIVGMLDLEQNAVWLLGVGTLVTLIELETILPPHTITLDLLGELWFGLWLVCVAWLVREVHHIRWRRGMRRANAAFWS
jgi:hypothetical protein